MRKITSYSILTIIILLISLIFVLSTVGIETNKFSKLISEKASKKNNIYSKLNTIKFKIDPKKLSLFLETQDPKITYRDVPVPVQNIKVYIDFLSLIKSDVKIRKTHLILEEMDISQINKLSTMMKPSNFKSILDNKIKDLKLISEIEIFLTDQGLFKNFIARGNVKKFKAEIFSDLIFDEANFSFFADKNDILIKNISGNLKDIRISDGDIKLNLENGIKLNSNFKSKIDLDHSRLKNYSKLLYKYKLIDKIKNLKGDLNNNIFINLDNTYKVKNYNYNISGKFEKVEFKISNPVKNNFIKEEIKEIYLSNLQLETIFNQKNISLNANGKYSFNNLDFFKINFTNIFNNDAVKLKLNLDYEKSLELGLINYIKPEKSVANLSLDLEKIKKIIKVNNLKFVEEKNFIEISGLKFKENKFLSFEKIEVATQNNNFFIKNGKKIFIKGSKFDATNLAKFFTNQSGESIFNNIDSELEIDFKNIKVPMSETLNDFKLIGEIKNGQFIKISSKGDFGGNNFLDISMKKDQNSNKKYLEIYSDLTRPLLTEYSFFSGLSGGKLLFTSIIDSSKSNSKLKIENFKVINAPGVVKLLSLADLGGLADLAKREGLSFDVLEINMEKNNQILKINEILALGPSMSVLMEGYQDINGVTSLRGTLVPAKTLNKMISKIPVIGNIVIPKEAGEGLFGISFKMKGPKGNIKTTINPIRTLTPRFIQKMIDRNKNTK